MNSKNILIWLETPETGNIKHHSSTSRARLTCSEKRWICGKQKKTIWVSKLLKENFETDFSEERVLLKLDHDCGWAGTESEKAAPETNLSVSTALMTGI